MRIRIHCFLAAIALLAVTTTARAQERRILSFHDDTYAITGPSLRQENIDVKFQFSLKVYPVTLGPSWQMYFAYTQTSVWDAYGKSAPFHDNLYRPGLFFEHVYGEGNAITFAFEHRSNGRPYFGNPLASETVEDYSRGMNYLFFRWTRPLNAALTLDLTARAGVGCGVGDYDRSQKRFTQDLFIGYVGYLDAKLSFRRGGFSASVMVTPLWNRSVANVTADFSYRITARCPALFAQFHYGYDEALCDCVAGQLPPCNIRFGIKL